MRLIDLTGQRLVAGVSAMVFLDCGTLIMWLTPMTQGAVVCNDRESEISVLRSLGCWTRPDPVEKFGDGF